MSDPPVVSGISPREGLPGTRVTIRGENLGSNRQDVIGLCSIYSAIEIIQATPFSCENLQSHSVAGPGKGISWNTQHCKSRLGRIRAGEPAFSAVDST